MRRSRWVYFVAPISAAIVSGGLVLANAGSADAAPFAGDNLVVYRVGDGAAPLTNAGTAVFLDELTPDGDAVQSIALPTAASGSAKRLVASGLSTSEGEITRSPNGKYLTLTGYDAALGATGPSATSLTASDPATTGRTVGVVDGNGTVDTSTVLKGTNVPSIVRSASTANGTRLWLAGGNGGLLTTNLGATTATSIAGTADSNLNGVSIQGGRLVVSGSSDGHLAVVGTGLPTTAAALTTVPGLPASFLSYGYAFLDQTAQNFAGTGFDTLYFTDAATVGGAIHKYRFDGTNWTEAGTVPLDGALGLTTRAFGHRVDIAVTTTNALYVLTDPNADDAEFVPAGDPVLIESAATNTEFRGVALAPIDPQGPSIWVRTPSVGQHVSGSSLTLSVGADVTSPRGIKNVLVSVDTGSPVKATKDPESNRWTASVSIGALAAGTRTIFVNSTEAGDDPGTAGTTRSWIYDTLSVPAGQIGPGVKSLATTSGIARKTFTAVTVAGAPGSKGVQTTSTGTITFTYVGRGFKLTSIANNSSGIVKVTENGKTTTISLYSATSKTLLSQFVNRPFGSHKVTISAPHQKVSQSKSYLVRLGWIEVVK